ncbi:MAG: geranylgeranylglycerol-phosphate geranylgeranyltransferase [Bacteroidota bacterium]
MPFLKLIRFQNLLIVVLTQYLFQYFIIIPALQKAHLSPLLDHVHFFLFVISTVIIAAGGYIINDITDYEIDILNKPERVIINKNISAPNAQKLYWGITVLGFLISLYIAYHIDNLLLVLIYPFAIFLLYVYSKSLKKSVLWGNMIVSVFCAFVAGIVLFAERENVSTLLSIKRGVGKEVIEIFMFYFIFAFLSTMVREIIKDIEDVNGDVQNECKTLPIVYGIPKAKGVATVFGITLLAALVYWIFYRSENGHLEGSLYLVVGIIVPLSMLLVGLLFAQAPHHYQRLSMGAKYLMLSGILYLFFAML